jgi:hypothetical protein
MKTKSIVLLVGICISWLTGCFAEAKGHDNIKRIHLAAKKPIPAAAQSPLVEEGRRLRIKNFNQRFRDQTNAEEERRLKVRKMNQVFRDQIAKEDLRNQIRSRNEQGVKLKAGPISNPILAVDSPDLSLEKDMDDYNTILADLKRLSSKISPDDYELANRYISDVQVIRLMKLEIFKSVNQMIKNNQFSLFSLNDDSILIHFENGYLTQDGYYQGVFEEKDGSVDFDGVTADQRLAVYFSTVLEAYQLAKELGDQELIRLFTSFTNAGCMDGRTDPIQTYLGEVRNRYNVRKTATTKQFMSMSRDTFLDMQFMESYGIAESEEEMNEILEFWVGAQTMDGEITREIVQRFVAKKFAESMGETL